MVDDLVHALKCDESVFNTSDSWSTTVQNLLTTHSDVPRMLLGLCLPELGEPPDANCHEPPSFGKAQY